MFAMASPTQQSLPDGIDRGRLSGASHKVVHHYLMGYISGSITVEGDPDHEAEDAAWVPLRELSHDLAYPNERRIVGIALDLLYRDAS